ncbi:MAG: ComEC/Rec2 family competence protein, partial [Clostridia bacterium]|nr:ComEC/Rec2 family competence protein [Clostridia bacterium]
IACVIFGMAVLLFLALLIFSVPWLRRRIFGVGLGLTVALLSLCHSFFLVDQPYTRSREMLGQKTVLCEVIEDGRATEYFSTATVLLTYVDGEKTHVKGELVCEFDLNLSVGDQLYAYATVSEFEADRSFSVQSRKDGDGVLLTVLVEKEEHAQIRRLSERETSLSMLTDSTGFRILVNRMKNGLRSRLNALLGEETGGLASGVFVGDTSDISVGTMTHFRRAGVIHLLSVSGLHLTILLGAIEWLLRLILIPKRIRIGIVSLCSLFLLLLTGFAPSAFRAVLMLLIVYWQFMVKEDNDSITALFSAVALIVLISPYSISDLGLWMSFLATLGILTVYPVWERSLGRIRAKKGIVRHLVRLVRNLLGGMLLTMAANLFLLPILWLAFGEFSLVGLLCNVAVSSLSSLFLVSIPVLLVLGGIPYVGEKLIRLVQGIGEILADVIEFFSLLPNGVISLRFDFAAIIIVLLCLAMTVLMLIRLKHKWLLGAVPSLAVLAFAVCFTAQTLFFSKTEAVYLRTDEYTETVALQKDHHLVILDATSGGWRGMGAIMDSYRDSVATEVETLILTHWHKGHLNMLESVCDRVIVRRVILPIPRDREEAEIADRFAELAKERSIAVSFLESGEPILLWDGVSCYTERQRGAEHDAIVFAVKGEDAGLLYLSSDTMMECEPTALEQRMAEYESVIVGCHGTRGEVGKSYRLPSDTNTKNAVYSSAEAAMRYPIEHPSVEAIIPRENKDSFYRIPLS